MGVIDEIQTQILASLNTWDFSPAFSSGYAGNKSVLLVPGWPFELIDNMGAETDGQLTRPIVSVVTVDTVPLNRSLGNVTTIGAPVGMVRRAQRVSASFLISCWADLIMGGADTAVLMGGQIEGWAFVNQMTMPSYRQLQPHLSAEAYQNKPQVWTFDVRIDGYALLTYDSTS